jgi:hypothetical protein
MSIPSLTERLDDLSAADKESAQVVPLATQMQELVPLTDAGQQFEPVQVASLIQKGTEGVGKLLRKAVKETPVRTERPILPEGVAQGKVGQSQVIRETGAKGEVIIESAPQMPTTGKPSPTPTEKAAGVPETAFNLDMIQDADGVKQFIEATARAYGADKIEKISYKQMAEELSVSGYDEGFIARIIDPLQATKASPQDAYKMQLALVDAGKRAFDLGEQVKAAKAAGELTPELTSAFMQAVALEGTLVKAVRGRQADIARTLGIFSQARQSSAERGAMLEAIMNEAGGIDSVHDFASKYTALTSSSARANMAENGYGNVLSRGTDMWMSTWINGLLSNPTTHAKNIAGNTFFGGLQIPERALASVIGKTRNFMFKGGEEAISTDEIYAQAMGFLQGIREGGEIAGRAFKNNTPTDPFQKIEATRLNREPFEVDFGDSDTAKAVSGALSYYGKFVTLPGRALMAEDEFFKAIGYRMELNALATRESEKMYKSLVESGVTPDNAARQAADFMADMLVNPTDDIRDAAMGVSRTVTFTRELEPALQGIQRAAQNPLIKMFVPFIKTPTNIALEAITRTPGLNFASPRFWGDFNAGGIRRDQAIARVTLGGAMIYSVSAGVFEGRVTGYGPMRMEDKKALEGTGWQQFSFVFDTKDVSEEMMARFEKLTTVSRGPDKVYISYAGLEPIGTLLGIGATSGEYAQMTPGGEDLDKLMMGGALGVYQYLSEQPMLSGFNDIMKVFTSGAKDGPTILYDFINAASKQVSQFAVGGAPIIGMHTSFVAGVERIVDPTKSNTMPAEMSTKTGVIEPAVRGFYDAVRYYKSRNPLTSDSLPRALDPITGEVEMVGKGKLYEMFNPFKESSGKYNQAKAVLVAYGVPMYIPKKSVDGIQLSATQYNRWIELATQDGALADQIAYLGESDSIQNLASQDLGKAQAIISKVISDAYSNAKQMLIAEDPELFDAMRENDEFKRDFGKFKR